MIASLDAVRACVHDRTLDYEVNSALDAGFKGVLATEQDHWTPDDYSRLFRAYSASCLILNESPDFSLIDKPVNPPNNISWLGRAFLELLNGTVERNPNSDYRFRAGQRTRATSCRNAEVYFAEALGHESGAISRDKNEHVAYVDDSQNPILFTKGVGDVPSSISFREITVNDVAFPAGTIFRIRKKPKCDYTEIMPGLKIMNINNISSIQPLRLSLFAIPHHERLEATIDEPLLKPAEEERQHFLDSLPAISMLDKHLRMELGSQQAEMATSEDLALSR